MQATAAFDTRFDGHSVLSCEMQSDEMARELTGAAMSQDLDIWSHSVKAGKALHIQVPDARRQFWESKGCKPMIEDVQEIIDQQSTHAAMLHGLKGAEVLIGEGEGTDQNWYSQYQRFDEIVRKTKELADNHPGEAKFVKSIGKSVEGRDIPVIHLTGDSAKGEQKPQIWLNGGQHAREWIAPAAVMYMTEHLLKDYKTDPEVKKIMDKFEFVVAPVINPDGYDYSHTGNRLWRKNRRKNADNTYGVDLNRNWGNHWGEGGASTRPSATDYQGTHAASEPEVQACQGYIKKMKHAVAGIDFHSYGNMILRSKGWSKKTDHDESLLAKVAADMKSAISQKRGTQYVSEEAAGLYPTTGSTDDWMSEEGRMWGHGWTIELPDSQGGGKGFLLPASEILPASEEIYAGLKSFAKNMCDQHEERERMGSKEWSAAIRRKTFEMIEEAQRRHESSSKDLEMLDSE